MERKTERKQFTKHTLHVTNVANRFEFQVDVTVRNLLEFFKIFGK